MLKKCYHFFLAGMLLFTSSGNFSPLFAQFEPEEPPTISPEEHFENVPENLLEAVSETEKTDPPLSVDLHESDDFPKSEIITDPLDEIPANDEQPSDDQLSDFSLPSEIPGEELANPVLATASFQALANESSNLKITEVYRLGTYEWLEITNLDATDFIGSLTLNGVKSAAFTLKNITIPAYASVIIADDKVAGIIDTEMFIHSDAGLNFTDANAINIELLVDGQLQDLFNVDSEKVGTYKSKTPRPSFERLYDHGERKIEATLSDHIFNIEGFLANPGKLTILGPATPRQGEGNGPALPSQLIISEVYFDDEYQCTKKDIKDWWCDEEEERTPDEEWIEIFNVGEGAFRGEITLSGAIFSGDFTSYTYPNVSIPAGGYLILANTASPFKIPNNEGLIINKYQSFPDFDIPDDQQLLIDLMVNNEVVDTFLVLEKWMQSRDHYKESVHKVLLEGNAIITRAATYENENISTDYMANPGDYQASLDIENPFDYRYEDGSRPPKTIDPTPPDACSEVESDLFTLTEIFRGGERYDPYLEFFIHEDMEYTYDSLFLSGTLLQTSLSIDLTDETESYDPSLLQKNTRLILTKNVGELSEAGLLTIVYHPDFALQDNGGELEIYGVNGQSRQLLDIVNVLSITPGKSTYHDGLIRRCGDNMDKVDDFSPGFGQEVLTYFSPASTYNIKTIETVKYAGGGGGCFCPAATTCKEEKGTSDTVIEETTVSDDTPITDDTPLPPKETPTEPSDDDNSSNLLQSGQNLLQSSPIKIVSLEPLNPESITLQSFLPYDIDFTKHTHYLKSSTATTKKYIDGTLSAHSIDTFTKNFGFLDAGACISLYSGDTLLDNLCYSTASSTKNEENSDITATTPTFIPTDYQIKILDIDYDPEGSDTNNETITLQNLSSKELDLANLKLKINTTNKKLTGILSPGETKTFKGTFGFPNSTKDGSEVQVSLFYDQHIFDIYIYNPNQPKVIAQSGEVKVFSVLDGDTFRFRKEDGALQSVRFIGVDAPESTTTRYRTTECFGTEAKTYLTNLIKNQFVRLEYDPTQQQVDSYGRLLAYVYLGDTLVNEQILLDGYAKEYTYKTDYQFQSAFQTAQQSAKEKKVGLWSPSTCGISIEDVPEVRGFDYDLLPLKITSLDYDPDGSDKDNETIVITLDTSLLTEQETSAIQNLSGIDFSDTFKLTIFPRGEYATGTTKNKSLEAFGFLPLSSSSSLYTFTLKGDFAFPNTKATCVSLKYKEYTFDTSCYNPATESEREEIILSGEVASSTLPSISIRSILPNPSGSDTAKEEITLLRTVDSDNASDVHTLSLSPDFYILVNNKTKKKLQGTLLPNQEITIKGSFSFPNTASCITLMKETEPVDTFCYEKAGEGVRFSANNTAVAEIPNEELSTLKKITLVKKADQLCVSYNKILFGCKTIPNSTTEKNAKLLSFQNNYIAELQNHLRTNYSLLYYDSDLKNLFDLYTYAKKEIKAGTYTLSRQGIEVPLTDVAAVLPRQQPSVQEYMVSTVVEHLPPSLLTYYQQERAKWWESLREE